MLCQLIRCSNRKTLAVMLGLYLLVMRLVPVDVVAQMPVVSYMMPLAYLALLGVAFYGLGSFVAPTSSAVIQLGAGMSAYTILCALLSIAHLYNAYVISALLFAGVYLFAVKQEPEKSVNPRKWKTSALIACFCIIAGIALAIRIYYPTLNIYDDYAAYMPFMKKLAFSGTLGAEPLSERRLISSLDSFYYLNSHYIYFLPLQFAHLFDSVFGAFCLVWLVLAYAGFGFGALVSVAFLFFPQPDINTLPYYLPIYLLCAFAVLLFQKDFLQNKSDKCAAGLILVLAVTMRSSSIPIAFFILLFAFLYHAFAKERPFNKVFLNFLQWGVALSPGILLFSSMHYVQTGTFLFPILGMGGHASQYMDYYNPAKSEFPLSISGFKSFFAYIAAHVGAGHSTFPTFLCFLAMGCGALGLAGLAIRRRRWDAVMMIGGCFAGIAVFMHSIGSGSGAIMRYSQPLMLVLLALVAINIPRIFSGAFLVRRQELMMAVALGIAVSHFSPVLAQARDFVNYNSFPDGKDAVRLEDDFTKAPLRDAYAELGRHIPADGYKTIARVNYPFLLDLTPDILMMDLAGGASPAPGIPYAAGTEAVASYFLQQYIRYIAWDYQRRCFYDAVSFRCDIYYCVPWINSSVTYIRKTADIFDALMKSRKILYQKDGIVLIDLMQKR